ncbi:hypothetical protein ADIS_3916 [Lunatimonas lonarensis]|uniref:Uncharacterized protein n=1 Tax=Lunatimonas lonarensis TaxID=1232681 RepID=R7ZN59_9BACT|nr:hypothetical protein ADIS_3916 [Lunatimonas lonarensis]
MGVDLVYLRGFFHIGEFVSGSRLTLLKKSIMDSSQIAIY